MELLNKIKVYATKSAKAVKAFVVRAVDKLKVYITGLLEKIKNCVNELRNRMMAKKNVSSKKIKKDKNRSTGKTVGMVLLSLFAAVVVIGSVAVCALMIMINNEVNADGEIDLSELSLNYATILYSGSEEEPVEYDRIHSAENRTWVDFNDIPEYVRYAFVDVEDERFETHSGVDWKRTIFAALNQIFHISANRQGGSTITQQLVKNITQDDEIHWTRKAREIVRALNLEKNYTKDEILEAYLNTIALGNNTAGIKSASDYYFGKTPMELTLAEAATIAAMTSMPVYYDPYLHPDNNATQREYVLSKMLEFGHITQEQYDAAVAEEIVLRTQHGTQATQGDIKSYFTDTVIEEVINDLVETKGYSYSRAESLVNSGGLQIYTTVDTRIQTILETKYLDDTLFTVGSTADLPQSAFLILDPNGAVKGVVGGRGQKTENRGLNRAIYTERSPGSSLKPLSVYMPMVEAGLINWSTIVEDSPVTGVYSEDASKSTAYPVNVYKGYYGNMTVTEAVQRSTNTIAMKLCIRYTPKAAFDFLTDKLGFTLIESDKRDGRVVSDVTEASMSLGALTDGATLLELSAGYLPIMNGGTYYEPHVYTKVYDNKGNLLLDKTPYSEQVVSAETAQIVNRLLSEVVYGRHGTAQMASLGGNIPVVGKTGTTDDYYDRLFIGMTPNYLGAVWIGYDVPKSIDVYRISNPCRVWRNIMSEVMNGVTVGSFPVSKNVVQMRYCTSSGLLAGDNCTSVGVGYYNSANLPGKCSSCSPAVESPPSKEDDDKKDEGDNSGGSKLDDILDLFG